VHSLNVRELITQVRLKVLDVTGRTWPDEELLAIADRKLGSCFTKMRRSGAQHSMDRVDVALSSFTAVGTDVYEYQLPEAVADIQYVEGIVSSSARPVPITEAPLEMKDAFLGTFSSGRPIWLHSKGQNPGSIMLRGRFSSIPTVRIWFIRSWGPLHYATASAGTTTSITVGTASANYKKRNDLYVGMQFEVTADSGGGGVNLNQIRTVTSFTSGVLGFVALPTAASTATQYGMVVPLPSEYHEYLVQLVAVELTTRGGNDGDTERLTPELNRLEADFNEAIKARSTGEPIRLFSSRGRG
jgi:hypothetical protein